MKKFGPAWDGARIPRPKTASRRPPRWHNPPMSLDSDACYRALAAHDSRFDGRFYVGVSTTRIYCRPVCTVRLPRRENCHFFASAAAAEVEGYRPCLRCRPELAPGNASVDSVARLAQGAVDLIENGVLDAGGIEHLSARVGVTSRHLRRIFETEFGVSPIEYAQTQRLLLAKRLLTDTALPVTDVASASGFASVRRFNALFKARYRMAPGRLREARVTGRAAGRAGVRPFVPAALRLGVDAVVSAPPRDRRRRNGRRRRLRANRRDRPPRDAACRPHRSAARAAPTDASRRGVAVARARRPGGAVAREACVRSRLRSGGGRGGARLRWPRPTRDCACPARSTVSSSRFARSSASRSRCVRRERCSAASRGPSANRSPTARAARHRGCFRRRRAWHRRRRRISSAGRDLRSGAGADRACARRRRPGNSGSSPKATSSRPLRRCWHCRASAPGRRTTSPCARCAGRMPFSPTISSS